MWLNVCPGTRISGWPSGQLSGERRRANRAGAALRQAAVGLSTSTSALGAYFRRVTRMRAEHDAARLGRLCFSPGIALKATAHKLARLIYQALTKGMVYVDRGMAAEEERYRARTLKHLTKRAAALGYTLSPAPTGGTATSMG